jgi:multiple sugar transport system permease protein
VRALVRPAQYAALAAYIVFLGFPLLWLISASVKSSGELNSLTVSLLPQEWHWDNYGRALARVSWAQRSTACSSRWPRPPW